MKGANDNNAIFSVQESSKPARAKRVGPLRTLSVLALVVCAPMAYAQSGKTIDVPVVVGGNDRFDACKASGQIVGLDPNGDGFLSVRSGPGGRPYSEIDRLYNGQSVFICGKRGPWLPVVYASSGSARCGVSTPWPVKQPYTGPCNFGWVHERYVRTFTGGHVATPNNVSPDEVGTDRSSANIVVVSKKRLASPNTWLVTTRSNSAKGTKTGRHSITCGNNLPEVVDIYNGGDEHDLFRIDLSRLNAPPRDEMRVYALWKSICGSGT